MLERWLGTLRDEGQAAMKVNLSRTGLAVSRDGETRNLEAV